MDKKPGPARIPGEYIRDEMKLKGWTQEDLSKILSRPLPTINRILQGKHAILPEMAIALGAAFGTPPELWMEYETTYRLSLVDKAGGDSVQRRAKLYDMAPIKEMEKRQWINRSNSVIELEQELMRFFDTDSLDNLPQLNACTRKSNDDPLTPSQIAWCLRVKHLAKSILVAEYREDRISKCKQELQKIAAYPQESYKVAKVLSSYGIRFVFVEPLTGCKVDGVAMWLDNKSPVIGMSLRYDRYDAFWFTLCHELSHIQNRDDSPVDSDISGQMLLPTTVKSPMERRADEEAANMLIPKSELESFIMRVGPLYSKDRINRFANRIKVHPGIIVGQLQHRGEIGYSANREMLVKIRNSLIPSTITDGWGQTINLRMLK